MAYSENYSYSFDLFDYLVYHLQRKLYLVYHLQRKKIGLPTGIGYFFIAKGYKELTS